MVILEHVQSALNELLPAMVADGGGVELVSLESDVVTLKLIGTCNFCPSRELSAEALIKGLRTRVPEVKEVKIAYPTLLNQYSYSP